ncbi:hypothetical protein A3Q34_08470 [Colwellia sp. PAMC 20917]|uniref:hypothetical protein n=1 Tax=Colwellia sp. PAMC 20917 TaxID=1816218 RepID=UPI000878470A|nr:hypothetical protein [Colwellia sp. PAMC 20917]AOW76884.1 hypothetical protein A3Q34_08470 [Colwellia sp. PAMC 20917]
MKILKSTICIGLLASCVSCVSPSSIPTEEISTLEKMGLDNPQRSMAGYAHWTSDIVKVTNLDTKKVIYKPSEWELVNPFGDMYLRLTPSHYQVVTRCTHSSDKNKRSGRFDELTIEVKGNEKMKLVVNAGGNSCTTNIKTTTYTSES